MNKLDLIFIIGFMLGLTGILLFHSIIKLVLML